MKVFIVSMGIIIMGVGAILFGWDYRNYSNTQTHLKVLTESSAAYAALCFDENEMEGNSDIVYSDEYLSDDLSYFVYQASKDMYCFKDGSISIEELEADSDSDSVRVKLCYTSDYDYFRSPFITQYTLSHISCYEWVSYELE